MTMRLQHFKNYTSVSSGLDEDDVCYSNIKCKTHNSRGTWHRACDMKEYCDMDRLIVTMLFIIEVG